MAVGDEGVSLETTGLFHNPNRLDGTLQDVRYELFVDGRRLGTGRLPEPVEAPGGADLRLRLPFDMAWEAVDAHSLGLVAAHEVPYRAVVEGSLDTPLGALPLYLEPSGQLVLPDEVYADAVWGLARRFIQVERVRPAGPALAPLARLAGTVSVRNPLPVSMHVRGARYEILVRDEAVTTGHFGAGFIPASQSASFEFQAEVDPAATSGLVLGAMLRRRVPPLRIVGTLDIDPLGGFSSFPFDFALRAGDLLPTGGRPGQGSR